MTSALRRSLRAVPVKSSNYNVGDIVEISRNNTVLTGQLAHNLTENFPSSSNPRWLVKFDNQKEEELYEHFFGEILKGASNNTGDMTMPPPSNRRARHSSSSEGEQPTKRVTFSESSPTASDDSSGSKGVSAREERSRRRQAKVDNDPVPNAGKRSRAPLTQQQNNTPNNSKKARNTEDVVIVKLLTGTLYLYRGAHRRAEFVRRV